MEERVIHDKDKSQFIITIDNKECYVEYNMENNKMNLYHTYTDPDLRGKGLAAKVVVAAFEYAKSNNLKIIPGCTYVQSFVSKHKEYDELLAE
jgi:predicted GNAT family acetyltransferase